MKSIDQKVTAQPGLIPQVIGALTHAKFCESTIFVDHYSDYFYDDIMRGTLSEETL